MFDCSNLFEKIAPNQYLYRNNRLRPSRAYLVTYKEKIAIERSADHSIKALFALIASCSTAMYFRPKIGCFVFVIGSISLILKLKADMKRIIGDRKKIPCHKEPFFSIFEREAQTVSWREIFELTLGMIFMFGLSIVLFSDAMTNNKSLLILAILSLLASLFSSYMIFLLIRHKPKKDQNT